MKPCKLNIQREILCKIIYALANFDSDHVHVLQRNILCMFRKGIFCIWYRYFIRKVSTIQSFESLCRLITQGWIIKRYRLSGQHWNHLYAEICMYLIVLFIIRPSHSFYEIYESTIQIFNNLKSTFFHHFSVRLEKCKYFSSWSLASTPPIYLLYCIIICIFSITSFVMNLFFLYQLSLNHILWIVITLAFDHKFSAYLFRCHKTLPFPLPVSILLAGFLVQYHYYSISKYLLLR